MGKRRLVGDPRLHDKRDKQQIQKLKKEDIERDRDKARRIQGVMQQCSKSRHQLVRMQNQLRNADTEDRGATRADDRGAVRSESRLGPNGLGWPRLDSRT